MATIQTKPIVSSTYPLILTKTLITNPP